MTVDQFQPHGKMNHTNGSEVHSFEREFPHGPDKIEENYERRWRGQQVQPQNVGTGATIYKPMLKSVAGVPMPVAGVPDPIPHGPSKVERNYGHVDVERQ